MQKKLKSSNKALIVHQAGFLGLVVLWILLILFKQRLGSWALLLFAGLVLLTIFGVYWINKDLFGRRKEK